MAFRLLDTGQGSVPAIPVLPVANVVFSASSQSELNSSTRSWTAVVSLTSAAPAGGVTIAWAVTGTGANPLATSDFPGGTFPSGTLNISAGVSSGNITFSTAGDTTPEADETGTLTLSSPTNCTLGVSTAGFTVSNDDVPTNSSLPGITGTATEGSTLTVSTGGWVGFPSSYTYRWFRNGTAISGATSSTYLLVTADVGTTITAGVIASNAAGASTEAVSSGVGPIGASSALAVAVESNGWVLAVTGPWSATSGAWEHSGEDRTNGRFMNGGTDQFPLDPSGTPKVMVTVTRQGFTRSGGQAVASSGDQEVLVATKPLRKPYPNQAQLDEVDNGDGTRTIRLALSSRVYAGDTISAVSFSSGWKAGLSSSTGSGLTNNSTRALPVVISRWATPTFSLCRGTSSFNVDVIVAAHHPRAYSGANHQAIAAMKLTATDGTNTNTYWFTAPQTSPDYGDSLRCWGGTIDLTGLTAGPITIHRTLYPWVGASRTTGSSHSTDATNGIPTAHDSPLMVCYDPSSTLYPVRYVYVNASTGTTTATSVTVATSLASAKAGTAAADISTAHQAIYNANLSLAARNGWAADAARAADWCIIVLAAGVQTWGATAITSGLGCNDGRLVIQGDPDDANPKANCIWRTGSAAITKRVSRYWLKDMTIEAGQAGFGAAMWHLDNVEVRGKSGYETDTTALLSGSSTAGYGIISLSRVTWWKFGHTPVGTNSRVVLARNCKHSRGIEAVVHVNGRIATAAEDTYYTTRGSEGGAPNAFGTWGITSQANSDAMIWNCRAIDWAGRFTGNAGVLNNGSVTGGTGTQATPNLFLRLAVVNSLCERSRANSGERIYGVGETNYEQLQDSIFEGMTMQGNGWNGCYNDSPSPFANLQHIGNTMRNCSHGRSATKHDKFKGDGTLTGSWEYLYGVNFGGNIIGNQNTTDSSDFQFAFAGLKQQVDTSYTGNGSNAFMKFTDDNSDYGPDAPTGTGNGDYTPASGAPHLGNAVQCSIDRDINGATRGATPDSGAIEA